MRQSFIDLLEKQGLRVVWCPSGKQNHYYAITTEKIGEGNFARVFKAHRVDARTGKLMMEESVDPVTGERKESVKPYAVKIFKDPKKFNPMEASLLGNYIYVEDPVEDNGEILLFSEYLHGENLAEEVDDIVKISDNVKNMTFSQRINLITTIALSINLIHHNTKSTGSAVEHADLKGSNIRFSVDRSASHHTTITDFGLAEIVEDEKIKKSKPRGMVKFSPIEIHRGMRGLKSDIYTIVPVFATILGAKYVLGNKVRFTEIHTSNDTFARVVSTDSIENFYEAAFKFDDMFSDYDMPDYPVDVKKHIHNMLNRMQDNDYDKRPNSDEMLRFFVTLNNFCKVIDRKVKGYNDDYYETVDVTLTLLVAGLWQKEIPMQGEVDPLGGNVIANTEKPVDFSRYDLTEHADIRHALLNLSKNNQLDYRHAISLFPSNPGLRALEEEDRRQAAEQEAEQEAARKRARDYAENKKMSVSSSGIVIGYTDESGALISSPSPALSKSAPSTLPSSVELDHAAIEARKNRFNKKKP